jgi:hypothetical protein
MSVELAIIRGVKPLVDKLVATGSVRCCFPRRHSERALKLSKHAIDQFLQHQHVTAVVLLHTVQRNSSSSGK